MRNFILGVLFSISLSSIAVTESADGSLIFTADEVKNINVNIEKLEAEIIEARGLMTQAIEIMEAQQKKIEKLQSSGKCI